MSRHDLPEVEVLTLDDEPAPGGEGVPRDGRGGEGPRRVWPLVLVVAAVVAAGSLGGLRDRDEASAPAPTTTTAPTTPTSLGPLPEVARDEGDVVLRSPDGFGLVVASGADAMRLAPAGVPGRIDDVVALAGGRWVVMSEGRAVLLSAQRRGPVDLGPAANVVPAAGGDGAWVAEHDRTGPATVRRVDRDGNLVTAPLALPLQRLVVGGGPRLIITGPGRLLEWWDPLTRRADHLAGAARPVGVDPEGGVAVVGPECTACTVHVRPRGTNDWMMSASETGVRAVGRGAFSSSGRQLAVPVRLEGGDDGVMVFDVDTKETELLRLPARPAELDWVPGGQTVVVLDEGGHLVTRWDVARGHVEHLAVVDQGL